MCYAHEIMQAQAQDILFFLNRSLRAFQQFLLALAWSRIEGSYNPQGKMHKDGQHLTDSIMYEQEEHYY